MLIDTHAHLERMLTRLKLTAIRDQLDSLLDEAGRRDLTIREALTLFCEREIARKDQRRIEMAFGLAKFPFARDLAGFDCVFRRSWALIPRDRGRRFHFIVGARST
jgi:DNA replication protein DnaC